MPQKASADARAENEADVKLMHALFSKVFPHTFDMEDAEDVEDVEDVEGVAEVETAETAQRRSEVYLRNHPLIELHVHKAKLKYRAAKLELLTALGAERVLAEQGSRAAGLHNTTCRVLTLADLKEFARVAGSELSRPFSLEDSAGSVLSEVRRLSLDTATGRALAGITALTHTSGIAPSSAHLSYDTPLERLAQEKKRIHMLLAHVMECP